ncbi:MAG: pyridoxamine 5'-phosphate oxidase family protein, partial [Pseudomonadota bacterium]
DFDHPRLADYPGAKVMVLLEAGEIFPNCPRYIPDLGTRTPSDYLPKKGVHLKKPDWKGRDYIADILPEDDPHR